MTESTASIAASDKRKAVRIGEPTFGNFPDAVIADGLAFTSGTRSATSGEGFNALPAEARRKQQGFALIDRQEGLVCESSWGAHARLEAVLDAVGSDNSQVLRQHIWQKDKRFFPCYESVRMDWQPTPAPSSGLGVGAVPGPGENWIGIDAIAVVPGHPLFTERQVIAAVDQAELPSASHYSQAVRSGPLVFTAGHIPVMTAAKGKPVVQSFEDIPEEGRFLATGRSHPDSRDGPIAAQTWLVYKELESLLARAQLTLDDVVLATVFLADLRDLAVFHRVHQHMFPNNRPALSISGFDEVGHRGCRIEIELTALDPKSGLQRKTIDWSVPAPFAAPAAVQAGPFVFFSGVCGKDSNGRFSGEIGGDGKKLVEHLASREKVTGTAAHAWLAFNRLAENLESAGGNFDNLVKLTAYLADADDLGIIEAMCAEILPANALPAFESVVIHGPGPLPGSVVQFEAIGHI